jgi:hypothetical protein
MDRYPDIILIQVTSTVRKQGVEVGFYNYIADELESKLSVDPDDVISNWVSSTRLTGHLATAYPGEWHCVRDQRASCQGTLI